MTQDLWHFSRAALADLLLLLIAHGKAELYGIAVRQQLAQQLGVPDITVPSVQSALRSLARRGLVFKAEERREYEIEDPVFREWLLMDGNSTRRPLRPRFHSPL